MDDYYDDFLSMVTSLYCEDPEGQQMEESKVKATINEYKRNPEKVKICNLFKQHEMIGYSILVYYWSNEYGGNILCIDELFIKEEYRNKGIGSLFIKFFEEKGNAVALQLETTPSNDRVFNYYQRLGFKVVKNAHLIKVIR